MWGVGLGIFMSTLDASIVNIALPTLVKVFNTSFARIQLISVVYLLVLSAFVLGASRLGDMVGKKRPYFVGLVVFTVSSLLCGLSTSEDMLLGFRILQGFGSVFLTGLGAAIVAEVFPDSQRGQALGIVSAIAATGIAIGPSVGGLLLANFGWQSIFFVNVPIGILASYLVFRYVPESAHRRSHERFDWIGTVFIAVTLGCFVAGMTIGQERGFASVLSWGLLATAAVGLGCFLLIEACIKQPILDLSIFRSAEFSVSLLACVLVLAVIAGILFLIPFFLETVLHYSSQQTGLLLCILPAVGGLIAPIAGRLSDRLGARSISLAGLGFLLAGFLAISTFDAQLTNWGYALRILPCGIGYGMFQSPNNSIVFSKVPSSRLSIASGLLSLSRSLGQTVGIPIMGTAFTLFVASQHQGSSLSNLSSIPPQAVVSGFRGGCYVAATLVVVAIVATGIISRRD